jgi:hypothetical protein
MLHDRLKARKDIRTVPVKDAKVKAADHHPVTNQESFSHSVLFTKAHEWRHTVGPILHTRTERQPWQRMEQHVNQPVTWYLDRGAHLRT